MTVQFSPWDVDTKCDRCGVFEPSPTVIRCSSCKHNVCEGCEVPRCDEGRHDCPFCGTKIADCSDENSMPQGLNVR